MTTTRFLWNPINQNIIREFDDDGNTIARYTTEPGLHGDVISQHRDGEESFYHSDGQGSTLALTNAAGDVTDTYSYNAFGEVTARTGDTVTPFQFIGQKGYYFDEETGECDVRQRPLVSPWGRWLSPDPRDITENSLRPYVYAVNSPVNFYDPAGLQEQSCGIVPAAMSCCCCAKNVTIVDIGVKNIPGGGGQYYGVDMQLGTHWKLSTSQADCTLEWWEWSSETLSGTFKGKPIGAKRWHNMLVEQANSPTYKPWHDRSPVEHCDPFNDQSYIDVIHDIPAISVVKKSLQWDLYFGIVLRSGKDCPCDPPEVIDAYAHLHVSVKNLKLDVLNTGLTIGPLPKPPGYPPKLPIK